MYREVGSRHVPHFHVYYQGMEASFDASTGRLLAGGLPKGQTKLVAQWFGEHQREIRFNWLMLQEGSPIRPILPL